MGSRIQLALNVTDVDAAVEFYSRLFGTAPAKRRDGYANFAVEDPPLKLVLIEAAEGGTMNHLGVELPSVADVVSTTGRLRSEGLAPREEHEVSCCYAVQEKAWVRDPDGAPWEVYTVLQDAPAMRKVSAEGADRTPRRALLLGR